MKRVVCNYICDDRGTSAVEFALVSVAFITVVLTIIAASFLFYTNMALQHAAETGARCYAIDAGDCLTSGDAKTWAQNHYYGLVAATFTPGEGGCGGGSKSMGATATMDLDIGIWSQSITLNGNACFQGADPAGT